MNIFRREDFYNFCQDVFNELNRLIITGTQYIVGNAPLCPYFIRTACTSEFWIRGQGCLHMTRQVDFRNNRDISFCRIGNDFFRLLLRIESAIRFAVVLTGVMADYSFLALRSDFRQFRILFDFDTPTLVFRQMPVETVDIVQGHHINICLDFVDRKEMTAHIQHHSPVTETGLVIDFDGRQFYISAFRHINCLAQRLDSIENTGFTGSFNNNLTGIYFQLISFWIFVGQTQLQQNSAFSAVTFLYFQFDTGLRLYIRSQEFGIPFHFLISGRIINSHAILQQERRGLCGTDFQRHGDDFVVGYRRGLV